MVRFSWHVEDGLNAYLPPGAYVTHKDSSVRHATCEIEVQNSKEVLDAVFTLPANYLDADKIRGTGIVLGHGNNASEWKGKLMTEIAVFLASQGYLVVRYYCKQKEQKRQKMFEKTLDACATSPFARGISKWILAGFGSGARVAAVVGNVCRGNIAGFVFFSYPLKEDVQQATKMRRGDEELPPPPKTSEEPLLALEQPLFFMLGENDEFCSMADLKELCGRVASPDVRVEFFEDANQDFKASSQGRGPAVSVVRRLCDSLMDYVSAIDKDSLASCKLAKVKGTQSDQETEATAIANGDSTPPDPQSEAAATAPPAVPSDHPTTSTSVATAGTSVTAATAAATQPERQTEASAMQQGNPFQAPSNSNNVPQLYQQLSQQVLGAHLLQNPHHAQQLLNALASQQPQYQQALQQQQQMAGFWNNQQSHDQPQASQSYGQHGVFPNPTLQQMLLQHMNPTNAGSPQQHYPAPQQLPAGAPSQPQGRPAPTGAQMLHGPPSQRPGPHENLQSSATAGVAAQNGGVPDTGEMRQ